MSTTEAPRKTIERYPDGKIPASRRYLDYDGQLVIRTRYATIQRWTKAGAGVDRRVAPCLLQSEYCRPDSDALAVKNDHLEANQFDVYYVESGETVRYEVTA